MFIDKTVENDKDKRIMQLENELAKIKNECFALEMENKKLNKELLDRFRDFFDLKKKDLFVKT